MKNKTKLLTWLLLFSSAGFSQGFYTEYNMTAGEGVSGKIKTFSQSNNTRSEIHMTIPGMPGGGHSSATLMLASTPDKIYQINIAAKTYTEVAKNSAREMNDAPQSDYVVTVLGKEKAGIYNCTHVKVKQTSNKQEQEMWVSTDLPGYADYAKIKTAYTGKDNLMKALTAKGAVGFPVRIKSLEKGSSVQMDLVKAEKKNIPSTTFSLAGYTKSAVPSGAGHGQPGNNEEMMKQMQNMTPEQREQMIKQMQQQYQNPK